MCMHVRAPFHLLYYNNIFYQQQDKGRVGIRCDQGRDQAVAAVQGLVGTT
jgi:hypothetical protein